MEIFLENILEDGLVEDAVVSQNIEHENELWSIRELVPVCLMQLTRVPVNSPIINKKKKLFPSQTIPLSSSGLSSNNTIVLTDNSDDNEQIDEHNRNGNDDSRIKNKIIQYDKLFKYDVSISLKDTDMVVLKIKKYMEKEIEIIMSGRILKTENEGEERKIHPLGRIILEYCCFGHAGDSNLHLNILLKYAMQQEENFDIMNNIVEFNEIKARDSCQNKANSENNKRIDNDNDDNNNI